MINIFAYSAIICRLSNRTENLFSCEDIMYWRHETADKCSKKIYSPHSNFYSKDKYYNDYFNPDVPITLKYFGITSCSPLYPIVNRYDDKYFLYYILSGKGWCNEIPFEEGDIVYCNKSILSNLSSNNANPCTFVWISFKDGMSDLYIKLLGFKDNTLCYKAQNMQEIIKIFYDMIDKDHTDINLPIHLESCLLRLLTLSAPPISKSSNSEMISPDSRVHAALRYINENFRNSNLRLHDIATATQTNEKYLQRRFKEETGMSIYRHITKARMDFSETLICTSNYNINEIAEHVGYNDRRCFSNAFKKYFGVYPSQYKSNK